MCRARDSIAALDKAADELSDACLKLCPDFVGTVIGSVINGTATEPLPQDMLDSLAKLRRLK